MTDTVAQAEGWVVTVTTRSGKKEGEVAIYDAAIADPVLAVEAVKKSFTASSDATIKVRSQLTAAQLTALRIGKGEVKARKAPKVEEQAVVA